MAAPCHRRAWSFVVYVFVWFHISEGERCRNAVRMRRTPLNCPTVGTASVSHLWLGCTGGSFDSHMLHATSRCPSWQQIVYLIKHVWGPAGHNQQFQQWISWTLSNNVLSVWISWHQILCKVWARVYPQRGVLIDHWPWLNRRTLDCFQLWSQFM